jgi:hypothetical protein
MPQGHGLEVFDEREENSVLSQEVSAKDVGVDAELSLPSIMNVGQGEEQREMSIEEEGERMKKAVEEGIGKLGRRLTAAVISLPRLNTAVQSFSKFTKVTTSKSDDTEAETMEGLTSQLESFNRAVTLEAEKSKEGCLVEGCKCSRFKHYGASADNTSDLCSRKRCRHGKDQHRIITKEKKEELKEVEEEAKPLTEEEIMKLEDEKRRSSVITPDQMKNRIRGFIKNVTDNTVDIPLHQEEEEEEKEEEIRIGCKLCDCARLRPNITHPEMCFNKKCRHHPDDHLSKEEYDEIMKIREEKRKAKEMKEMLRLKAMGRTKKL